MLSGVDVSELQGEIDWPALAAQEQFAMVRLDFGLQWADAYLRRNLDGVRATGILGGFYHELDPDEAPAAAQALLADRLYDRLGIVAPHALGLEDTGAPLADFARAYAQTWIALGHSPPLIYLDGAMLQREDYSAVAALGCGLWLAQWDGSPQAPTATGPWRFAAIKQYSDQGTTPGIAGAVDLDVFYGTPDEFRAYG